MGFPWFLASLNPIQRGAIPQIFKAANQADLAKNNKNLKPLGFRLIRNFLMNISWLPMWGDGWNRQNFLQLNLFRTVKPSQSASVLLKKGFSDNEIIEITGIANSLLQSLKKLKGKKRASVN